MLIQLIYWKKQDFIIIINYETSAMYVKYIVC